MAYLITVIFSFFISFFKGKWQVVTSVPLVVVLIILMAKIDVDHSFDTSSYLAMYDLDVETKRFEPGYLYMTAYFYTHGFSYMDFRLIYFTIFTIILWLGIIRFKANVLTFFWIYAVFPLFIEMNQVRNFAMISLVVLGLSFVKNNGFINLIIGTLLIYVGSLFQVSGLVYILIPIALVTKKKNNVEFGSKVTWNMFRTHAICSIRTTTRD